MSAPHDATKKERREAAREERRQAEAAQQQADRRRKTLVRLGVVLAAAVAIVAVLIVVQSGNDEEPAATGEAGAAETVALYQGIPQDGFTLGDPKAPLTMVEFLDMQCPFCGEYSREVLPTIVRDYIRAGKVRYEMRLMAFLGADSQRAGEVAAGAAEQNRVFEFVDSFMRNQGQENSGYVTDEFLRDISAGISGLDIEQAISDASGSAIERGQREASAAGIQSTPSFLLGETGGGKLTQFEPGALEPNVFTEKLDEELAKG